MDPFESVIWLLGVWILCHGFDANAPSWFLDRGNTTGHWNDIADYSIPDFGCQFLREHGRLCETP